MKTKPSVVFQIRLLGAITIASAAIFAGCNAEFVINGVHTGNGYHFTKTGDTAETIEMGTFEDGISKIVIENVHGGLDLRVADGEPKWTWKKKVWADSLEQAETFLVELDIDVTLDETNSVQTWTVVLPEPSNELNGVESYITMNIPGNVAVEATNSHGEVLIENIEAPVVLHQSHGDVRLNDLNEIRSTNSHGDLYAANIGTSEITLKHGDGKLESIAGDLKLKVQHGDLSLKSVEGMFKGDTQHSDLHIENVNACEVKAQHGDLKILTINGDAKLSNQHGDIMVSSASGKVSASSQHGKVNIVSSGEAVKVVGQHAKVNLTMENPDFTKVEVDTSFKDIVVNLPTGVAPHVSMEIQHGKTNSGVDSVEDSKQQVILKNQHGDISVK